VWTATETQTQSGSKAEGKTGGIPGDLPENDSFSNLGNFRIKLGFDKCGVMHYNFFFCDGSNEPE
jgi:hypothetical protein